MAPGLQYAEECSGTNGIGTALDVALSPDIAPTVGVIVDLANTHGWRLVATAPDEVNGPATFVATYACSTCRPVIAK